MDDVLMRLHSAREAAKTALELIETSIANYIPTVKPARTFTVAVADLILSISDHFRVEPTDILGKSRRQNVVKARHTAWYLLREINQWSLTVIGQSFGVDHTSVWHAIHKIENDYEMMGNATVIELKLEGLSGVSG